MRRYDKYKDTGIGWLPELPSHWGTKKISSLFDERRQKVSDKIYPPLSVSKNGITPQLEAAVKTDNGDNRKLVKVGDFVVNSRSDRKGSCGISSLNGSVSLINIVLRPKDEFNARFFHFLSRSKNYIEEYYRLGRGIVADLWTTRYSELKNINIPFPPLAEQEKIVNYLNNKISKIDEFLLAKEEQIRLLHELKESEIANVITRGLNPNVKMKDSGIPWIGMIPEHWKVKRIASLFTGKVDVNSYFTYKKAFKFNYGALVLKEEIGDIESYRSTYTKYSIIKKNDIIINGLNLNYDYVSQRVAIAPEDGIITSAYIVARPRIGTNSSYYTYLFKSMDNKKLFHGMGKGIRLTLSFEELKKQLIPVPTPNEQCDIVAYIEERCNKVNSLIIGLKAEIEYLKEYKQSLIADCVTGQINVQQ